MASLSKRIRRGQTNYEIRIGLEPNRSTIWLGGISKTGAHEILNHVVQLEAASGSNSQIPKSTKEWIQGLSDRFYSKLVKARLLKERSSTTVGGFFAERLEKLGCAPRTHSIYELAHKKFFEYVAPELNLRDVTPEQCHDFYHVDMVKAGMAHSYRAKTAKIIREFFDKAVNFELIEKNPFAGFQIIEEANMDRHVFIDRKSIKAMIDAAVDIRWRCLLGFAGLCGLRTRSEIAAIHWEHIHWDGDTFTVPRVKTKERTVPIFGDFREYLEAYHRQVIGPDMLRVATGPIFPNCPKQSPLTRRLNRTASKAGLQPWAKPWMNLRSSCETSLVTTLGFDLNTVTKWLGNSPDVARKHYLQIKPDDVIRAAKIVTEKSPPDSPPHVGEQVSKNAVFPNLESTETRGKVEKYTRQESNL